MSEWNRCHMSTWTTSHTFCVQIINQPESYEALWTLKKKSLRETKQIPMFTLDTDASLWSHWNDGYVHRCVKQAQSDQWEPHQASWKINSSRSSDHLRRRHGNILYRTSGWAIVCVFVFKSTHGHRLERTKYLFSDTTKRYFVIQQ